MCEAQDRICYNGEENNPSEASQVFKFSFCKMQPLIVCEDWNSMEWSGLCFLLSAVDGVL